MPREGITAYDLLISCPTDVEGYLEVIKESVDNFNRVFGVINNIQVVTKHWSTDSYPQSGDNPQELLNKQFVRDCDAAVAIFWTRFGTPTDKYGSGTEEEIEEMLSAGKQVFMYFLNAPFDPSKINPDQLKKVLAFKEKYKNKGVYIDVKNKEELRRRFTNHLSLHFLPLISGDKVKTNIKLKPALLVKDIDGSGKDICFLFKHNLCESKFMSDKREQILKKIDKLKTTCLPDRVETAAVEPEDKSEEQPGYGIRLNLPALTENLYGETKDVCIDERYTRAIKEFALENGKSINEDFLYLGGLKKYESRLALPFGGGISLDGSEEEKQRYTELINLCADVISYNEYKDYFAYIDGIHFARLVVSNVGNSFDEDINVKLIISKGNILRHLDLPYPGINIINNLSKMGITDFLFSIQESETVDGYGYYPIQITPYKNISMPAPFNLNQKSVSEEYEEFKNEYRQKIESLFIYKFYENEISDILIFHVKYLKHNTSMAFPSVLLFKGVPAYPAYIEYEISSKHTPDVIKGKLEIKQK